jgi:hypothetical protein
MGVAACSACGAREREARARVEALGVEPREHGRGRMLGVHCARARGGTARAPGVEAPEGPLSRPCLNSFIISNLFM